MTRDGSAKMVLVVAVLAIIAALGIVVYLNFNPGEGEKAGTNGKTPPKSDSNFREEALAAGITFRMAFLPNEQGENFKINLYDHGCGVAIGDFDGDGHEDIYFLNQLGPNGLFRNKGDGTFEDVSKQAGVALGDRVCVGAVFADTRNNGRQDLFVTSTRGGNVLFRNNGDGTFTDITKKAGLEVKPTTHAQTAVFFDFDNDGFVDLFVTNSAKWTLPNYDSVTHYFPGPADFWDLAKSPLEYNVLYRNNGDGTFTDVTAKAGVAGRGWGGDVAVFDYNHDGHLDLFVTNMFGASQLYRNNGNGTFTDVTKDILGRTSWGAIGCKVFDFNNDGRLDLLIADMHSDMWWKVAADPRKTAFDLKKKYDKILGPFPTKEPGAAEAEQKLVDAFKVQYQEVVFGNTFFKQLPSGKFEEISAKANLETWWPWGIATGDFDNDGYEDVFLPSGMGYPYKYWPNALLMNNGNETFSDRAAQAGIEPPPGGEYSEQEIGNKPAAKSSRCAAVADFDGDGRIDLIVNNFNDRPYYFKNYFLKKNYVAFRLTGSKCNRDAIGALVKIYVGKEVLVRQVQAAGGYLSQSSRTLHFGLGERATVDRVEIVWPGSPASLEPQTILNPAINKLHRIAEPVK